MNKYIGHETQLSGCHRIVYDEGALKGMQAVEVYHDTGLRYTVLLGRGMDIAYASYKGRPFAYVGKSGFTSATYFQHGGKEWGRAFGGGLVTTCGLDNVGPGFVDEGDVHGDHGRFSSLTAEQVSVKRLRNSNGGCFEISGILRQATIFGENFLVSRTIRSDGKDQSIILSDQIVNEAFEPQPLMLMYHCNYGFPLLSEKAELTFNADKSQPRDETAKEGFAQRMDIRAPQSGFQEQVFYHAGTSSARLWNPEEGFGIEMCWNSQELPCLTQWNQFGAGDYVLGLEPGNCHPVGRHAYLDFGHPEILKAGEKKVTHLKFSVISNHKQG